MAQNQSSETNKYTNPGVGVWHYNFGDKKTAGSSIGLHVPATTKRDNTTYQAVLEWSMAVAP
ncbi:WxL domain-containing protein [Latilactobacillus curvatus]